MPSFSELADQVARVERRLNELAQPDPLPPLVRTGLDAAAQHIRTHRDLVVAGGTPTHYAALGTVYWDSTNDLLYINNDGANGWTSIAPAASATVAGIVELATAAETDTGTDATRAVTPDGLQASFRNLRFITIRLVAADTSVSAGADIAGDYVIPFDGTLIQDDSNKEYWSAYNDTAGVTGTMVVDVNLNGTTVMTTNKLDIETTEKSTTSAATQPDLTTTDVSQGDILTFDIDAIHSGTAAKGLSVCLAIRPD